MKEKIKSSFDYGSKFYDEYSDVQNKIGDELLKFYVNEEVFVSKQKNKMKVLDLGSGTGDFSIKILNKIDVDCIHLLDLSSKMIEKSKKKIKASIASFEINDFDFYNNFKKFDLIVSNMAIHWSANKEMLLKNIIDNLCNKSAILFSVPNDKSFNSLKKIFCDNNKKFIFNALPEPNSLLRLFEKNNCLSKIRNITFNKKFNNPIKFLKEIKMIGANSNTTKQKENFFFLRGLNKKEIIIDYQISLYLVMKR